MNAIRRLDYQKPIFADRLSRFELLKVEACRSSRGRIVHVSRNHGFEQVASVLPSFLALSDLNIDVSLSDYDDSLVFQPSVAEVEILWVEFDHYTDQLDASALCEWLLGRLENLRASSRAPIIVANFPGGGAHAEAINTTLSRWSEVTPATAILDLAVIWNRLGSRFYDDARVGLTGTRLSDAACLESARVLGLQLLPNIFLPRIKAIALDLDDTLYSGVLGEDGPSGVELTEHHRKLQELLCGLVETGLLLAVVSRNEREDVDELFRIRSDFPLNSRHISSWQISWGDKAQAIQQAAQDLRIGADAFLFVDDNLGELAVVSSKLPSTKLLFAGFSAAHTVAAISGFPALWPSRLTETDRLRTGDLAANTLRENLALTLSPVEYLKSLEVKLVCALDPKPDLARLRDICAKTNQFNLALARLNEIQIGEYLNAADSSVVHIRLSDRLADSGSVAALFIRQDGRALIVDELCISCRAIGRMLEDILVTEALAHLAERRDIDTVRFVYAVGPRNQPARRWLKTYTGLDIGESGGVVDLAWTAERAGRVARSAPVSITWID